MNSGVQIYFVHLVCQSILTMEAIQIKAHPKDKGHIESLKTLVSDLKIKFERPPTFHIILSLSIKFRKVESKQLRRKR